LLVDTGASTVVLPNSMMEELGFKPNELRDGESQTAAGSVNVKLGQLYSVQVGHAHLRDVAVGFIDDDKLGEQPLLGMSFLGRFRLTIDDENNRVMLLTR
jgi:aspartyl protease family protein